MLTVDDYGAIRRAHRDGMTIREIAHLPPRAVQDPPGPGPVRAPSAPPDQEPSHTGLRNYPRTLLMLMWANGLRCTDPFG